VIIVASVSCIYGIGSPEDYQAMTLRLSRGTLMQRQAILRSWWTSSMSAMTLTMRGEISACGGCD